MLTSTPVFLRDSLDLSYYALDARAERYIAEPVGSITAQSIATETRPLQAQVVVDEAGSDELMITEHPVQRGAVITDHAVRRPSEIRVRMGWSNAYLAETGDADVRAIYERILTLQAKRIPFTVYTGKRVYENMLVASLQVHTDARMEYTFLADIAFREVILVDTQVFTGGRSYDRTSLATPEKNQPTDQTGEKQGMPASIPDAQFNEPTSDEQLPDQLLAASRRVAALTRPRRWRADTGPQIGVP